MQKPIAKSGAAQFFTQEDIDRFRSDPKNAGKKVVDYATGADWADAEPAAAPTPDTSVTQTGQGFADRKREEDARMGGKAAGELRELNSQFNTQSLGNVLSDDEKAKKAMVFLSENKKTGKKFSRKEFKAAGLDPEDPQLKTIVQDDVSSLNPLNDALERVVGGGMGQSSPVGSAIEKVLGRRA